MSRYAPHVCALASLASLATAAVAGPSRPAIGMGALAMAVIVALLPARVHTRATRELNRLVALLLAAMLLGGPWQLSMVIAVGLFVAGSRGRTVREALGWSRGRVPLLPTVIVAGVTPLALVTWLLVMQPDLSDVIEGYVPDLPLSLLIVGAVGFVLVNAVFEEVIWRGVLQDRLCVTLGHRAAVVLQAASFGLQHAHGVPRGVVGVLMAFAWALMLGWLRRRADGLLAPILAHVVADATIAAIVFSLIAAKS